MGSGVVRIDPLRFLAGCCKRRLNQALSVLSLSLYRFLLGMCVVLLTVDSFFRLCYFYVICVFCRLVVLFRLSVPVQVIDGKDSSPMTYIVDGDVKPYSLTHSLTHSLNVMSKHDLYLVEGKASME